MMVVLVCVIGMIGIVVAVQPVEGTYDPNNPLEFVLACCQWEMMKKMELSILTGQAPDERIYTPAMAALDYVPSIVGGIGQFGSSETKSYEATSSCCGQYGQALAQTEMDIALVGARYQAWKAAQVAAEAEPVAQLSVNQTPILAEQTQVAVEILSTSQTPLNDQPIFSALAVEENGADENVAEAPCEACAEAQLFAEWLFSKPKAIVD